MRITSPVALLAVIGVSVAFSPLNRGTRITSPSLKSKSVQLLLTTTEGAPFKLTCDQAKIRTKMQVSIADYTYFNGSPPVVKEPRSSSDRPSFLDSSPVERKRYLQKGFKEKIAKAMRAEAMPIDSDKKAFADLIKTINTSDDETVLFGAMLSLKGMLKDQDKQDEYVRLGGPLAVVTTILRHPESQDLQECALVTLTVSAEGNPAIQAIALDVGGVSAILQAMESHPSSRAVQEAGIMALSKVCDPQPTDGLTTNAGGVPLIVRAMETFVDDEELVLLGSQLLDRLSNVARSQKVMIESKVLSALSTIVQTHQQNKDILTLAGRTMIRLVAV